ncbi:hypothetical protein [Mesorhizobium sp.]|uniref:hypothetical protein n=1 Tax=Mesorhizobium sp. TaxID=1871066 RepID=UPI000FE55EFF|nr:hypothetical protein [Mesorhizobium sp.]RWD09555.1 MAG: hypothetical protein EOS74_31195 [Mesorhizobium sp.]RWF66280.1 MAG: hypothetical protein EOS47_06755 [Mesorhizobium sp.]
MPPPKIEPGDRLTIEVDGLKKWHDGRLTFSLFAHPGKTTISGDSPRIVKVEKGKAQPKTTRSRDRNAS